MKIGNFEVTMENKKERSKFSAIFQTIIFFAGIFGVIAAVVYWGASFNTSETPKSEGYKGLNISTLADFDYEIPTSREVVENESNRNSQIPEKIMKLDGQKVAITGFMMPVRIDNEGNVEEFALNGNYDMCFYGAPSRINQWVHVKMNAGEKVRFSHNPTTVSGVLEVGELVEDGEVISLYRLKGDKASVQSRKLF